MMANLNIISIHTHMQRVITMFDNVSADTINVITSPYFWLLFFTIFFILNYVITLKAILQHKIPTKDIHPNERATLEALWKTTRNTLSFVAQSSISGIIGAAALLILKYFFGIVLI